VLGQELAGDTGLAGSVRALHFHKLGGLAYEALGRPLEPPPKTDREANRSFWEEEVPLVMAEALEAGKLPRFDAVVVDEAQDFAPYWWDVVEDCLKDRATGSLLVFLDPSQDLYGRPLVLPTLDAQFTLRRNYRNTQEIFELLQRLGAKDLEPHPEGLHGDRPSVHQQEGPAKTLKQVGELLRRLVGTQGVKPEQIAILTPHSLARSTLAGQTELQGIPLAFDPLDRKGAVLHSTIAAFKGLESEVLILLDLDAEDDRCCPNALYVACSRATQSLHIFAKGNWLAGVI
jgi:superfamily I DNA/RNA helicase